MLKSVAATLASMFPMAHSISLLVCCSASVQFTCLVTLEGGGVKIHCRCSQKVLKHLARTQTSLTHWTVNTPYGIKESTHSTVVGLDLCTGIMLAGQHRETYKAPLDFEDTTQVYTVALKRLKKKTQNNK